MKKVMMLFAALFAASMVFAVSYRNNTYQKLADEYATKAQIALDAGQYDDAVEYSRLAEENAELSKAYIELLYPPRFFTNFISESTSATSKLDSNLSTFG